jgi:tRNA 2-thiouridine synthesizing protein A
MRCPQPIQAIITNIHRTHPGDILQVTADCPTFEDDVRKWAERSGKTLLAVTVGDAGKKIAQIQV